MKTKNLTFKQASSLTSSHIRRAAWEDGFKLAIPIRNLYDCRIYRITDNGMPESYKLEEDDYAANDWEIIE